MEYSEIISLLTDPDKLTEGLVNLDEYNKDMTERLEKAEKSVKELRDSNIKLYLRVTGKPEETEEKEETFEDFIKKLNKED